MLRKIQAPKVLINSAIFASFLMFLFSFLVTDSLSRWGALSQQDRVKTVTALGLIFGGFLSGWGFLGFRRLWLGIIHAVCLGAGAFVSLIYGGGTLTGLKAGDPSAGIVANFGLVGMIIGILAIYYAVRVLICAFNNKPPVEPRA